MHESKAIYIERERRRQNQVLKTNREREKVREDNKSREEEIDDHLKPIC